MTLHTRIALTGDIDPIEAHHAALVAICTAADEPERIATALIDAPRPGYTDETALRISTTIGQGLPGIVDMNYREGGAMLNPEPTYDEYEDENGVTIVVPDDPRCTLTLGWDTAYTFTGPGGMGCTQLHAVALAHLYQWASNKGVSMSWHNEYNGTWHEGLDGLAEFFGDGDKAMSWFGNAVVPAIPRMIEQLGEQSGIIAMEPGSAIETPSGPTTTRLEHCELCGDPVEAEEAHEWDGHHQACHEEKCCAACGTEVGAVEIAEHGGNCSACPL
jgi:hypothetical protein